MRRRRRGRGKGRRRRGRGRGRRRRMGRKRGRARRERRRRRRRRKNHALKADRQPFPNTIAPVIGPYPAAKSILMIYSFGTVNKPGMLGNRLRA